MLAQLAQNSGEIKETPFPDKIWGGGIGGGLLGSAEPKPLFGPDSFDFNLRNHDLERKEKLLKELQGLGLEYSEDPSITMEQKEIFNKASGEANILIDILPSNIPTPSIVSEPEGGIGFEWFGGKGRVFVISMEGSGTLIYAGINEGETTKGTIPFSKYLFPKRLSSEIKNLFI